MMTDRHDEGGKKELQVQVASHDDDDSENLEIMPALPAWVQADSKKDGGNGGMGTTIVEGPTRSEIISNWNGEKNLTTWKIVLG